MGSIGKKLALAALVAVFSVISLFGFGGTVYADSKPKIKEITKETSTSITLPIKFEKREDDKVVVKVKIRNKLSGMEETRTFNTRLGKDDGRKKITVDGLKPGTEYSFKVQIKKRGGTYSPYSDSRSAFTKVR